MGQRLGVALALEPEFVRVDGAGRVHRQRQQQVHLVPRGRYGRRRGERGREGGQGAAAGTGLRLFWSWVVPGDRTRGQSLAAEGRSAGGVALGLVVVLLVSGVIEGFVTPSGLPTWARVGIGVVAEVLFLAYVWVLGRRAVRAGHTGDVDASLLEDRVATAG